MKEQDFPMLQRLVALKVRGGFRVVWSMIVFASMVCLVSVFTYHSRPSHNSPVIDLLDKESACVNPYAENGFVWFRDKDDVTEATWVPFYEGILDQDYEDTRNIEQMNVEQIYSEAPPPREVLELSPFNWIQALARLHTLLLKSWRIDEDGYWIASKTPKGHLSRDELRELREYESLLSWVKNRRMLMVSDSVDRFQLAFFCDRLDQPSVVGPQGRHSTQWCHVPYLNFTIVHWHISSFVTNRPSWWWDRLRIVPLEERWTKFFLPTIDKLIGMNGISPDLVILQSGLWDQRMYAAAYMQDNKQNELDYSRPLNWAELRFYMQRERTLVALLREQFGNDVPIVYRISTLQKSKTRNSNLHDINRAARFVAHETDMEIMNFGDMVHGHEHLYFDFVHIGAGPLSTVWANMLLAYLFRGQGGIEVKGRILQMPTEDKQYTVSKNWNFCHEKFMNDHHKWEG
ncbi:uncharacterized protein V1513DRAFT_453989 [Lipomyces chichibuensis]|uniref:uncharacterized protein n=1 Tax=Lipomyces chichibuensis TaxID=1546026 RepID=UPI0033431C5B